MTYENKAFPHTSGTAYNHYGTRNLQDGLVSGGSNPRYGTEYEAVVYVRGSDFDGGTSFNTQLTLPKGAVVSSCFYEVDEAFVLGGTTPTIAIGADGTEVTNYAALISEADAETAGLVGSDAPAGTIATTLAADTAIGVALGGTTPTVTDAGSMKVVIYYNKL